MLLSDREIRLALESGDLVIDPPPPVESDMIQPASIDLHLHPIVRTYKEDVNRDATTLDIGLLDVEAYLAANTDEHDISQRALGLRPGDFVIGQTLERVRLSNILAGRVEGRSRLARMGIGVHLTAPKIDPGFDNRITLEIFHVGKRRVEIPNGMAICTLLLERLGFPASHSYSGVFQGET